MGRVTHGSRLEPGSMLSVGGKEIEVDTEIPKEEYLSGRIFLEHKSDSSPPVQKKDFVPVVPTRTPSAGPTKPITANAPKEERDVPILENPASKKSTPFSTYKKPLLETTAIPQTPANQPVPRHDPNAPGALVMKRPDSVPKGKQIVDVVVDPILTKNLRHHQREGVKFLYECAMGMRSFNGEGAILADDMGLGKTLQTITLLWTLLKQNPIYGSSPVVKKALVVCPVTLVNNWRKEFRKWLGNERIGVFVYDDKRKRLTDFTMGKAYNVMVVGYEKLRTVQENLSRGAGVDIIIADEGHRLKTLQNKSGQAIQSLNTTKRIILSGTPIQNDLREFFATVDLVNPGVLGTFKAFVKEFEGPIVRSRQPEATRKDIEKGEARSEELRELTSKFILRRTADILAKYLPPKTEYVLFCNPTSTQANIYRNVLASPVFQCAIGNPESALQLITTLKKLCNSPSLLSSKNQEAASDTITALLSSLSPNLLRSFSPSSSAKIRVLDQLLHNLRTTTSEKIVLVSHYTSTLTLLATLLTSLSLPFLRLDGSTPAQKRQSLVEDFNRLPASACFAFLLSAKAGGTGLNLVGASRLVLFDVDWNPATDLQAMARIHRDGQKRPCRIYRILLKGSLEEKIWQRQVTKIGLADSVMEHKDNMSQFSRDELRDLFRLDEESTCQTHDLLGCDCGGRGQVVCPDALADSASSPHDESDPDGSDYELPDLPTLIKASELDIDEQEGRLQGGSGSTSKKNTAAKKNNKMHQSLAQFSHIDPSLVSTPSEESSMQRALDDDDVLFPLFKEEDNRVGFVFKKVGNGDNGSSAGRGGEQGTD
jgi:DNA repair and recombination protein RAD54B